MSLIVVLVQDTSGVSGVVLPSEKCRKLSFSGSKEKHDDESMPGYELENIVGLADCSQLEVLVKVQGSNAPINATNTHCFSIHKHILFPPFPCRK